MTETELVKQFAEARGFSVRGPLDRAGAREILLPLLILDICYTYICKLRIDEYRFMSKRLVKGIHSAYNHVNAWFFGGLRDQLEDATVDLMDNLEESLNLDILIFDTAVWNVFKVWPEPTCSRLVACYVVHALASAANATWGCIYRGLGGVKTMNRDMSKIAADAKRLAEILMGNDHFDAADRLVNGLRTAETVLGRKLVQWTRKED